ncbi:peptidase E [Halalkalibacter akibai]|uniref:Peptidase E n=1 Tax=Halalkalibacter akibai (strain ATCC 43226 / DSM 21942 / CIP 109018 / JCM 9157 / 1139) TaxID=1236973 RepID=W4QX42_HALA3|nr:peptidase E [Halalkalibacter akibai]GAE36447.1 peptidase E [Halalkalibacter akibai JCM 9157]
MERNILTISGGGFSEEDNAYIDEYLLKIARKQEPLKIAFIATASSDAQSYIDKFYEAFKTELPSHITMRDFELPNIQEVVNALDIVYVGGGNTQYMLEIWQKTGFDNVLRNAYQKGVILAGISAGAMCWFETCYSEKNEEEYEEFKGLDMLKGSLCPHYNDTERRIAFNSWATTQKNSTLYTLEDNENLHFKNEKLIAKIIT